MANITAISQVSDKEEFLEFQLSSQNQLSLLKILVYIFSSGMKLALDTRKATMEESECLHKLVAGGERQMSYVHH